MEVRAIVLMIIKIVISIPTVFVISPRMVLGSALMGGHIDNRANSTLPNVLLDLNDDKDIFINETDKSEFNVTDKEETFLESAEVIPNPEPLVVPGYNLPDNIFNKGKPFYLEKDPLTGHVDFLSKASDLNVYDEYEYDDRQKDVFVKENIDRKDSNIGSHKPNDVNQLTPTLYEFLNLPVKYNPDKYVYPLISSSYANTKVQGNLNGYHNHKDYSITTYKPTKTPTYYPAKYSFYSKPYKTTPKYDTTTTEKPTTTSMTEKTTSEIHLTSEDNLMNSPMNDPSYGEDIESTPENKVESVYLTTTTTEKVMSFFEQLYLSFQEDMTTTTRKPITSTISSTTNQDFDLNEEEEDTYDQNVLTGSHMEHNYNEEYDEEVTDNIAVENKPQIFIESTTVKSATTVQPSTTSSTTKKEEITVKPETTTRNSSTFRPSQIIEVFDENDGDFSYHPNYKVSQMESDEINTSYVMPVQVPNKLKESLVVNTPPTILIPPKVTSMPLGDNHVNHHIHQPIILATQNLREQLKNEKIPAPFTPTKSNLHPVNSGSNIHVASNQDVASFVIGNQQKNANPHLKESPYDSNPFRPFYGQNSGQNYVSYILQANQEVPKPSKTFDLKPTSINIQPIRNSEASLAIGVPVDLIQGKPGQVMDESLEINEEIKFPKGTGPKIVFPDDEPEVALFVKNEPKPNYSHGNKEILKLNSKPMLHQLPSDLTPPPHPPYDPRPGHFQSGIPEYARPPRPNEVYKRIDKLPNILPQFRPNMKMNHRYDMPNKNFYRQPLLERPSNRPIGFFEKLHPPPPPKNLQHLRKVPQLEQDLKYRQNVAEDRIINEGYKKTTPDQFMFYQTPPKIILTQRRKSDADEEVETLQMIQAKGDKKDKTKVEVSSSFQASTKRKDTVEKPLYVVYPVNTAPLKLDAIDTNKKETVVIGTRAELPLPPSKIQESNYDSNDSKDHFDFNFHERHDSPILKPHPRPNPSIKSEFPYPLERPDPSLLSAQEIGNNIDSISKFESNNWNSLEDTESRIVSKINTQDQISVKLKTYTEKPIAVAYTPTEPHHHEKYSMPNYASPVIPEIRPNYNSEFTVSAVMHTHPKVEQEAQKKYDKVDYKNSDGDLETTHVPQLDFQAPFQASINVDNITNGWSAVREKSKTSDDVDTTTAALTTTNEFDIENFKPQLIGGFKPIYDFPEGEQTKVMEVKEREE